MREKDRHLNESHASLKSVQGDTNTIILGAGISGLSTAHALWENRQPFLLLETSDRVGGAIQTTISDGYLAEHGPNSLLIKDKRVASLLQKINLGPDQYQVANQTAKKRYIVHKGQPHSMPTSPLSLLKSPLFSWKGKWRILREPFIGKYQSHETESFADFVRRRLGPEMLASAAAPFVNGIYAGNPENLSVRHAFPRLWKLEHNYRSCLIGALALQFGSKKNPHRYAPSQILSFNTGMHAIPANISKNLPKDNLQLACQIQQIKKTDQGWTVQWQTSSGNHQCHCKNLICTAPHHKLNHLPFPSSVSSHLHPVTQIESPPVTSLTLGFKREDVAHPLDGFGMLIKQSENSPLLGVIFSSSMFSGRAPKNHVTLTCMMGGSMHPEYAENTDATVLAELKRLLGVDGQPTFHHKVSWTHAIPQYGLDYQNVLDALTKIEKSHSGLHFAGNYRGGISLGDTIINGLELGKQMTRTNN